MLRVYKNSESGSALVMALFVLVLVGTMGVGLLFMTGTEMRASKGALNEKRAFYLAEAAEEDARLTLFAINGSGSFDDDLVLHAGANGQFDLVDAQSLLPIYDEQGSLTGVSGHGDDVPLRVSTPFQSGFYMAFVTNDPADGVTTTVDTNNLVMITGAGAGPDGSFEVVQAIVERWEILPQLPPATVTMLGPDPIFDGGTSDPHLFTGNDCGGRMKGPGRKDKDLENQGPRPGVEGLNVPVVATIGPEAEAAAEQGISYDEDEGTGPDYTSGDWQQEDTFADLTDSSEPTLIDSGFPGVNEMWTDCEKLHEFVEEMRNLATVICHEGAECALPAMNIGNLIFADGDFEIGPAGGAGALLVTGTLTYNGTAIWNGMVFVFGEGKFVRKGAGNGLISGAIMVADIAGPDGVYGNADDCEGGEDGFDSALFDMSGGGVGETVYCSADILASKPNPPYRIVSFRQL